MGGGIFNHSALFSNLRLLPSLSSLSFGPGAIVSADELISLVSGPSRHPTLTLLTLDMLTPGRRGERLHHELGRTLHPEHKTESKHVAPSWHVPEFSDVEGLDKRFSHGKVERLVKVGAENGVRLDGQALQLIETQESYQRLLHNLEKQLASVKTAFKSSQQSLEYKGAELAILQWDLRTEQAKTARLQLELSRVDDLEQQVATLTSAALEGFWRIRRRLAQADQALQNGGAGARRGVGAGGGAGWRQVLGGREELRCMEA
ncbi:hypothetical protein JCM8547_003098 [Rhodosporidiobolus lusitaniae]